MTNAKSGPGQRQGRRVEEYGTTPVVLEVLREAAGPLTAKEIVAIAGERLPTRAAEFEGKRNVVARDLARELARGDAARVRKVGRGLFEAVQR
jgi:hypothetical protein